MILATAPTRLGLFGGGTDLPIYSSKYGGVCINMAINLRQFVVVGGIDVLQDGDNPAFFKAFTREPVYHTKDMPAESGLGSSASLAVALLGAVNKMHNKGWTKDQIAELAWEVEVNKLGLFGGKQDQYACIYGGLNEWTFTNCVIQQNPFPRSVADSLSKRILVFYSGENRKNTKIQEQLKELTPQQKEALDRIKNITHEAYHKIYRGNYKGLGGLLKRSWIEKKKSNPLATNERLDEIHNALTDSWGSKTSGSGGGGFCFCIADPKKHDKIINKMESIGCVHYDFGVDYNGLEVRKLP
jgi:D-glycero-alpha-D-manno-heptose-7-phosphate kinase